MGPRAGRALDRAAHGRRGVRAGAGRRRTATTRSCSTSSATCSSRCTSCRCCSRSAGTGRWPRWPTTCTPSSCAGTRTSSARSRSRARRRGAAQLGPDQEGRGRARAGDLRRRAGEPARAAVRAQDAAAGGVHGLRLRPRALRGRARRAGRARGGLDAARSASTRSATCCSRRSTSRASSRSTRSSRCGRPPSASATRVEAAAELAQRPRRRVGRARPRRPGVLLRAS